MGFMRWLQSPNRILGVFLCLMLILGGALGWLGLQMLKQDRALERQRLQELLERETDRITATFQQSLQDLEIFLNSNPDRAAEEPPDDMVVLHVIGRAVNAYPPGSLLFYPLIQDSVEPSPSTFARGEILEFRYNDPAGAAEFFRDLAASSDPGVRAGALFRLGRNLHKAGRFEEALRAYSELAEIDSVTITGLPAQLVAHEARGTVLEEIGRSEDLRQEAWLFHEALWSGRWNLPRPAWTYYAGEARRWLEPGPFPERELNALALSQAAELLYAQWSDKPNSKGRQLMNIEDRPVLMSWTGTEDRLISLLAGPDYLSALWRRLFDGRNIRGALEDTEGHMVLGSIEKNGLNAVRMAPATGLPGTVYTAFADPNEAGADFSGRRRLLLAGFAVLALVLLSGSYFIVRSINREHAVARLQSEFVSTVSHEFRTPLTSLCQLSEMLSQGRIPTDNLRQKSYDILAGESARLQRLVESLLDFGRLEAKSFRYLFEPHDPVKLVNNLVVEFREKAEAIGYRVELTHMGTCSLIQADREALGLALRNLLDNAVKYSPDCRTVWVETLCEDGRLFIRVRDNGIGIPASERKKIFKRFMRGGGSRTAHIQGTGIGLSMARQIVEAHDGEIRLESEPGKGSTFTILLPVEEGT
jgi:signal transduction histidine kinase